MTSVSVSLALGPDVTSDPEKEEEKMSIRVDGKTLLKQKGNKKNLRDMLTGQIVEAQRQINLRLLQSVKQSATLNQAFPHIRPVLLLLLHMDL